MHAPSATPAAVVGSVRVVDSGQQKQGRGACLAQRQRAHHHTGYAEADSNDCNSGGLQARCQACGSA